MGNSFQMVAFASLAPLQLGVCESEPGDIGQDENYSSLRGSTHLHFQREQ